MDEHKQMKNKEWTENVHIDQRTKHRSKYPVCPSSSTGIYNKYVELLRDTIKDKEDFHGLVLGATPELRDMVLKHGGQLTTLDISQKMIEKCNPLMECQNYSNENIVYENWIESTLGDNSFDLIMGDAVSNNIKIDEQWKFFSELKRMLKPGGKTILREGSINPDRPQRHISEIQDDYILGKNHWFDMFIDMYFYSEYTKQCKDEETRMHYMSKFWELFEQAYEQGEISQKAFDAMHWFKGDINHTVLYTPEQTELIEKYFKILSVEQVKDFKMTQDTIMFLYLNKA